MVEQVLRRGIGIDNHSLMVKKEQGGGHDIDGDLEMRTSGCQARAIVLHIPPEPAVELALPDGNNR